MMFDVPNLPGVPSLLGGVQNAVSTAVSFLVDDLIGSLGYLSGEQWGIFFYGLPVVTADTIVDMSYKQEWVIADYPLERGAFETYDKVAVPFDARIRFVSGGSESKRADLLSSVRAIAGDYNKYIVITPEGAYPNCNVRHYDYHRSSKNGLGLLYVDVWLQQVRVNIGSAIGDTSMPDGASQSNGGAVQPVSPDATQQSAITAPVASASGATGATSGLGWAIK